jgi:protein TonB
MWAITRRAGNGSQLANHPSRFIVLEHVTSAGGPLTIRPEGEGSDVRRMFADQPTGRTRVFSGTAIHIVAALVLLAVVRLIPQKAYETLLPDRIPEDVVWIVQPGPSGGGGGSPKPEPPKAPTPEPVAVPEVRPPDPTPVPPIPVFEPPAIVPNELIATNLDAGLVAPPGPPTSGGRGRGTGAGPGPARPGNGVSWPVLVRQVKPQYTAEAVRAKTQGTIRLECVVERDGSVGMCEVVRSLAAAFGLDAQAVKAAQQWQFRPALRAGEPVSVRVPIELDFTLR